VAAQTDDVAQVEQLKELELLGAHYVELHVKLQARAITRDVSEGSFSVGSQRDDAARDADFNLFRLEFVGSALAEFPGHLARGMRPVESVRIGSVSQRFDFDELFAALLKLVERLEFQRGSPF
jgi:hypothetical protein